MYIEWGKSQLTNVKLVEITLTLTNVRIYDVYSIFCLTQSMKYAILYFLETKIICLL